jgi:putative transposase
MPWSASVSDEKLSFIMDWQAEVASVAELCRWYGVSRDSGHKLINRFRAEGLDGLKGRSRAPHSHPNAVSEEIVAALLAMRRKYPSWGSKKIRSKLAQENPSVRWPALSTINEILSRHGLTVRRHPRRRAPVDHSGLSSCAASNDVWGVDFKGWFRTLDGMRCDPLSMTDLHSRFVLKLQIVTRPDGAQVWPLFDAAFREFGRPRVMRSDNGPPFAAVAVGGLSSLAVRLIKAGVRPERIAPGKPQQNGRHERLHRTLKDETASPPAADLRAQQRRFDRFRRYFNEERPHEALGQVTPGSVYQPPSRNWSGRLREPEYGSDHLVRRVRQNGEIKWQGGLLFLGEALIGEPVGLVEADNDRWTVSYGPIELGTITEAGKFARSQRGHAPAEIHGPPLPD